MPIDTEITGSPGSVRRAATFLGDTLKPAVGSSGESFLGARRSASADWRGRTSAAFGDAMGRAVTETDQIEARVGEARRTFDDYAGSLERCQDRMTTIRADARAAELEVAGFTVQDPGSGPSDPGDPPTGGTQAQMDSYNTSVTAWNDHQEKVRAFNRLAERATEVWTDFTEAVDRVSAKDHSPDALEWGLNVSSVAGGAVVGAMEGAAGHLAREAAEARRISNHELDQARRYGHHMSEEGYNRRMNNSANYGRAADDLDARSGNTTANSRLLNRGLGAAGFALGFGNDVANGESVTQAAVSNGVGLGASIATGAAVGTMIGGPVGTVVGAAVGTVVGLAASEFADGMFETGGDVVESAVQAGDAVVDAGAEAVDAVGDAAGAIADGIGGLF